MIYRPGHDDKLPTKGGIETFIHMWSTFIHSFMPTFIHRVWVTLTVPRVYPHVHRLFPQPVDNPVNNPADGLGGRACSSFRNHARPLGQ